MKRLLAVWLCLLPLVAAAQLPDFTDLVDKQGPAVVNVSTTQTAKSMPGMPNIPEDDPMFEFFKRFMPPNMPRASSRHAPRDRDSSSAATATFLPMLTWSTVPRRSRSGSTTSAS